MVHKKFIIRNGKKYGPYYYESYREDGKVKKRYFTPEEFAKIGGKDSVFDFGRVKFPFLIALISLILIGGIIQIIHNIQLTSRVSLDVETNYETGEALSGLLRFNLKQGELIPTGSKVIVNLSSVSKEFLLSELVDAEKSAGSYYAEGVPLAGSGEGYGLKGSRAVYPIVNFELLIAGNESNTAVSGNASKGSDFAYMLEDGQNAELVSGSVKANGEMIGDNNVSLAVSGNEARASTDYEVAEEGFGADFIGSEITNLDINISKLGLDAEEGTLSVQLVYGDTEIVSASKEVSISEEVPAENLTENITEEILSANTTTNENVLNETVNETIANATIRTSHGQIRIGEQVRWTKNIVLESPRDIAFDIPASAENIVVKKVEDGIEQNMPVINSITGKAISASVSAEIELSKEPAIVKWFKKFMRLISQTFVSPIKELQVFRAITGKTVSEIPVELKPSETGENVEISISDNATEYVVEYSTDAPQVSETIENYGKKVIVSGPGNLNYSNIATYTNIPEALPVGQEDKIKIYWVEGGSYVNFDAYDRDSNGLLDYIEWLTPHLSSQTFMVIILAPQNESAPEVLSSPPAPLPANNNTIIMPITEKKSADNKKIIIILVVLLAIDVIWFFLIRKRLIGRR